MLSSPHFRLIRHTFNCSQTSRFPSPTSGSGECKARYRAGRRLRRTGNKFTAFFHPRHGVCYAEIEHRDRNHRCPGHRATTVSRADSRLMSYLFFRAIPEHELSEVELRAITVNAWTILFPVMRAQSTPL